VSSTEVVIHEEGALKAAVDVAELAVRAEDTMPVWPELNGIFHADEERRFASSGPGWAQLAQGTLENKARLGQSSAILRATERLKRSLTTAAGIEPSARPGEIRFGTDVPYARFHQFGTVNMPRREVVGISPVAARAMVQVLSRWIAEGRLV